MTGNKPSLELLLDRVAQGWTSVQKDLNRIVPRVQKELPRPIPNIDKRRTELSTAIVQLRNAARNPPVTIATTGTTSSGKSTAANVLIGAEVLPKAVQEMSAGIVTVIHDDHTHRLVIEPTKGAQWETGQWDVDDPEIIRKQLQTTMRQYLDVLDGSASISRDDLAPPECKVIWPTRMGLNSKKFGLPDGTKLQILDLPGLKYVNDEGNGAILKSKASEALCIVTYNSFETDPQKQEQLLSQVAQQVKGLGGSPARMLFVLNRIDAFLSDSDPATSEKRFTEHTNAQIRKKLTNVLPEYKDQISELEAFGFSSEPALFATLAQHGNTEAKTKYADKLLQFYRPLFTDEKFNAFPWSPDQFTDSQHQTLLNTAITKSRRAKFDDNLGEHIRENLPELLIPNLTYECRTPTTSILDVIDKNLHTHTLNKQQEVKTAKSELESAYEILRNNKKSAIDRLAPLAQVAEDFEKRKSSTSDGNSASFQGSFSGAVEKVSHSLDIDPNKLMVIETTTEDVVGRPIRHLFDYVLSDDSHRVEDEYLEAWGVEKVREAKDKLLSGPYGNVSSEGGTLTHQQGAQQAYEDLQEFISALSTVANNLMNYESGNQEERIQKAIQLCAEIVTTRLIAKTDELISTYPNFPSLRSVFDLNLNLPPLHLPLVTFQVQATSWSREYTDYKTRVKTEQKRDWKRLWLTKKTVKTTIREPVKKTKLGLKFHAFDDYIAFVAENNRGIANLENALGHWLSRSITQFSRDLEKSLDTAVDEYRRLFLERSRDIERGAKNTIEKIDERRKEVEDLREKAQKITRWREFSK